MNTVVVTLLSNVLEVIFSSAEVACLKCLVDQDDVSAFPDYKRALSDFQEFA